MPPKKSFSESNTHQRHQNRNFNSHVIKKTSLKNCERHNILNIEKMQEC